MKNNGNYEFQTLIFKLINLLFIKTDQLIYLCGGKLTTTKLLINQDRIYVGRFQKTSQENNLGWRLRKAKTRFENFKNIPRKYCCELDRANSSIH